MELHQDHDSGKEFFVTISVFQLGIIKFSGPEAHRFVILDNVSSHLIAGSISVILKGFVVIRVSKEEMSYHKCFHAFKCKVHFLCPTKCFLSHVCNDW